MKGPEQSTCTGDASCSDGAPCREKPSPGEKVPDPGCQAGQAPALFIPGPSPVVLMVAPWHQAQTRSSLHDPPPSFVTVPGRENILGQRDLASHCTS